MATRSIQSTVCQPPIHAALEQRGYALVEGVHGPSGAADMLADLGRLMAQYDGNLTHEVRHRPGNEGRSYSQSTNRIQAHTEAPGWNPRPAWFAVYCHRQARSGGGPTDPPTGERRAPPALLDVERLLPHLSRGDRALLADPMWFPAPASVGGGVTRALLDDGV